MHHRNLEHENSYELLEKLIVQYPKNVHLVTRLAETAFEKEQMDMAITLYRTVRRLDSTNIKRMDSLAMILYRQEDFAGLSRLANDALDVNPNRPEGWLVAAMAANLREDVDKTGLVVVSFSLTYSTLQRVTSSRYKHRLKTAKLIMILRLKFTVP